jgi:hypothetical protein
LNYVSQTVVTAKTTRAMAAIKKALAAEAARPEGPRKGRRRLLFDRLQAEARKAAARQQLELRDPRHAECRRLMDMARGKPATTHPHPRRARPAPRNTAITCRTRTGHAPRRRSVARRVERGGGTDDGGGSGSSDGPPGDGDGPPARLDAGWRTRGVRAGGRAAGTAGS